MTKQSISVEKVQKEKMQATKSVWVLKACLKVTERYSDMLTDVQNFNVSKFPTVISIHFYPIVGYLNNEFSMLNKACYGYRVFRDNNSWEHGDNVVIFWW